MNTKKNIHVHVSDITMKEFPRGIKLFSSKTGIKYNFLDILGYEYDNSYREL